MGNALEFRRNPVDLLRRGYETLGPVFSIRLGPKRAAVILGPESHQFFFAGTDANTLSMSEVYKAFVPIFGKGFTLAAEPDEYKEQRAILQPAFHSARMPDYFNVMLSETLDWLDNLGEGGEFEVTESLERLSLNVVARAVMGEAFRRRMGEDFWPLYRDVVGGIEFLLPTFLPLPRFRRRDRARRELHARIGAMITERRAAPNGDHDFMQTLAVSKYSDGTPVPVDILESMILFLVFSASESTPLQASWSLIQLLQHPQYLARVLEEQEAVIGKDAGNLKLDALHRLNRLEWALKETERMRPMTTMLWRYTTESYEYGGYLIPKGWITIISPAISHSLPHVFPHPEQYDPERFSPDRAEDRKNPFSLAGFGGGTHKCPGMRFANTLMKVAFSLLFQRYELELLKADPKPDFSTTITRPESPCLIRYRPRRSPTTPA